jgi:flavin-dependent thymidylate synthase
MKIELAGYNLDANVIDELKKLSPDRSDITPETLSAAYARISRDPRPINELRVASRKEVERSRKSNQAIIFGLGHSSVAEHAVFNFDIIGATRLAMESIEKFRLASFTEKSQRYITLKDDFLIPSEIRSAGFGSQFESVIGEQNAFYHKAFEVLKAYVNEQHSDLAADPKNIGLLEGWAKEDARYITSLATHGQVGMTVNARTLELMMRRFKASNLKEVNEIGQGLYDVTKGIAPSVIKYTDPSEYDIKTYTEIAKAVMPIKASKPGALVSLEDFTKNGDILLVASLIYSAGKVSFADAMKAAAKMSLGKKKDIIKASFKYAASYDRPIREFEMVNLTYDLIISASCYAQLKRHRLATQILSDYDPELGLTIPEAIKAVKLDKEFKDIAERAEDLFYKMQKKAGAAAQYILTNAHRRRVLLGVNARELYHISRLREDKHAQWDIRNISAQMSALAKKKLPLTFQSIGGKDSFRKA